MLIVQSLQAQEKIERFFDYSWKLCDPSIARYYSVKVKQDSVWHQQDYFIKEKHLQMEGYYTDTTEKIKHGLFMFFHSNGILKSKGRYDHNKKEGLWVGYHDNGMMSDSAVYLDDIIVGDAASWYADGNVQAEEKMDTIGAGTGIYIGYFENEKVSAKGRYSLGMKANGKWNYYRENGQKSADIVFNMDSIVSAKCYNEEGIEQSACDIKSRAPEFPGGIDALHKYIEKNTYWPSQFQFKEDAKAVVVVDFTVDTDGSVKNVSVEQGFHPEFDKIAVIAIKTMPKWKPAMQFNRKVPYSYRQAVFFEQTSE